MPEKFKVRLRKLSAEANDLQLSSRNMNAPAQNTFFSLLDKTITLTQIIKTLNNSITFGNFADEDGYKHNETAPTKETTIESLSEILKERYARIKDTNLMYSTSPGNPINQFCAKLADFCKLDNLGNVSNEPAELGFSQSTPLSYEDIIRKNEPSLTDLMSNPIRDKFAKNLLTYNDLSLIKADFICYLFKIETKVKFQYSQIAKHVDQWIETNKSNSDPNFSLTRALVKAGDAELLKNLLPKLAHDRLNTSEFTHNEETGFWTWLLSLEKDKQATVVNAIVENKAINTFIPDCNGNTIFDYIQKTQDVDVFKKALTSLQGQFTPELLSKVSFWKLMDRLSSEDRKAVVSSMGEKPYILFHADDIDGKNILDYALTENTEETLTFALDIIREEKNIPKRKALLRVSNEKTYDHDRYSYRLSLLMKAGYNFTATFNSRLVNAAAEIWQDDLTKTSTGELNDQQLVPYPTALLQGDNYLSLVAENNFLYFKGLIDYCVSKDISLQKNVSVELLVTALTKNFIDNDVIYEFVDLLLKAPLEQNNTDIITKSINNALKYIYQQNPEIALALLTACNEHSHFTLQEETAEALNLDKHASKIKKSSILAALNKIKENKDIYIHNERNAIAEAVILAHKQEIQLPYLNKVHIEAMHRTAVRAGLTDALLFQKSINDNPEMKAMTFALQAKESPENATASFFRMGSEEQAKIRELSCQQNGELDKTLAIGIKKLKNSEINSLSLAYCLENQITSGPIIEALKFACQTEANLAFTLTVAQCHQIYQAYVASIGADKSALIQLMISRVDSISISSEAEEQSSSELEQKAENIRENFNSLLGGTPAEIKERKDYEEVTNLNLIFSESASTPSLMLLKFMSKWTKIAGGEEKNGFFDKKYTEHRGRVEEFVEGIRTTLGK